MDCSRGFTTPSGTIKRVNSPIFFNLALIPFSPWEDIDRHLFVVLWAFSLTVTGEQTERAVGKELGQLVGDQTHYRQLPACTNQRSVLATMSLWGP